MWNTLYLLTILLLVSWIFLLYYYKYTKSLRNVLAELLVILNRIRKMDFDVRLNPTGFEELNLFEDSFNSMINMVDKTFEEIDNKNNQLDAIINSVTYGIIVIDKENKIFMANDTAKIFLKCNENKIENSFIFDAIKEKSILEFLKKNVGTNKSIEKEITIEDGKVIKLKIDPVRVISRKKIEISSVLNIEDITERMKLENMRHDFAANVSHELKTPLTSIQGFVETLKNNDKNIDSETRIRFLNIIENESDRLRILINDILLLSSIESQLDIKREMINIKEVNEFIFNLLEEKAKKNNITLKVEFLNKSENFYTYKQYFKELLINLITNGIKYNKKNGYVKVIYYEDDKSYFISVEDNGIGISENEKERIFERFYRVNKSRDKGIDGTGLGLAIIKHILISLEGNIELESKIGKGSTFKIILPKY